MGNFNKNNNYKLISLLPLLLLINSINGLYEDQIQKFDWHTKQIGKVNAAEFLYENSRTSLIVSTAENVIAALNPKSGQILWRQILENSPRGDIKLFRVFNDRPSANAAIKPNSPTMYDILTVQGASPAIIRGWSSDSGNLEWEWSLMPLQPELADDSFWFLADSLLYHVIPIWGSHIEVTAYLAATGQARGTTSKISSAWIRKDKCVLAESHYNCIDEHQLLSIDLSAEQPAVNRKPLPTESTHSVKYHNGGLFVNNKLISFSENTKVCPQITGASIIKTKFNQKDIIFQASLEGQILKVSALYVDSCESVVELSSEYNYENYGEPKFVAVTCSGNKHDSKVCRYILSTMDGALISVKGDQFEWIREESLTQVIATEFVDFPLSDSEGTLESELNSKTGGVLDAFVGRISSQFMQYKHILQALGLGFPLSAIQQAGLVRDSFGLHKMLVVVTSTGKIFGLDNLTGKIHWIRYLPSTENFSNGENMKLVIQRTSKYFPMQPICTIIARDSTSGNGVLYTFNPITGLPVENGLTKLDYKIRQLSILNENKRDFIKGILLLDEDNALHVVPENTKEMAADLYLFIAEKDTAVLNGYIVKLARNTLKAEPIWNIRLGGVNDMNKIIAVSSKNPIERIHSQGRVLGDRSVLYKYINPNLVAVVTEGLDSIHKYVMNVYLVDAVTGSVVFSMTHRRVRGPINIVHSENWLTYSYYNEKVRRTEITSVELYEGKFQSNSSVWSSLDAPPMPLVERQSYIVPTPVEVMKETITERGITNKHVLIGTTSGSIVEMPWMLLDPRRPVTAPNQPREDGIIPYIPELPFPSENIINYNQTIAKLRNIFTSPSGLESTCLVVATGLDIFVTRVSPSKTFDLLKEDFDYFLILAVLIALTSGSLFVKQLSSRKMLRQAWK